MNTDTHTENLLFGEDFGLSSGHMFFCIKEPFALFKDVTESGPKDTIEFKTSDWKRYIGMDKGERSEYEKRLLAAFNDFLGPDYFAPRKISLAELNNYPRNLILRNNGFTKFYAVRSSDEEPPFIEELDPYIANPGEFLESYRRLDKSGFHFNYQCVRSFYKNIRKFLIGQAKYTADDIRIPEPFSESQSRRF